MSDVRPQAGPLVEAVRHALAGAGDPERAIAQQAYMKSAMPYRGITSPELRRVLRPVLGDATLVPRDRAQWEAAVRTLWDEAAFREERYAAIALTRHRGRGRGRTSRCSGSTATSWRAGRGGTSSTPSRGSGSAGC